MYHHQDYDALLPPATASSLGFMGAFSIIISSMQGIEDGTVITNYNPKSSEVNIKIVMIAIMLARLLQPT